MTSSRSCNALEVLFVQCNIRYATGVSFEPVPVEKAEVALRMGLQVTCLDRLQVDYTEESLPQVTLLKSSSSPLVTPQRVRITHSLVQTLEELVAQDTSPAIGGVSAYLLIPNADDSLAIGVAINANHALCDGWLMRICIESVLQRLMEMMPPKNPSITLDNTTLGDLTQALLTTVLPRDPPFLPLKGSSILKLNEMPPLLAITPSESSVTVRTDIDASTVTACHHRLQSKATLTGFMMACWIQAISEVASRSDSSTVTNAAAAAAASTEPVVSISCLVDIRSQLPPNLLYTNAFGTVTVSAVGLSSDNNRNQHDLANGLMNLAELCTNDLQRRIQRGEARLQSLVSCQGESHWIANLPPATIELSNHGVYNTTPCTCELALQQRFDGYDGVSISMVTERNSGVLRVMVNAGSIFCHDAIKDLLNRVVEFWHIVALLQGE